VVVGLVVVVLVVVELLDVVVEALIVVEVGELLVDTAISEPLSHAVTRQPTTSTATWIRALTRGSLRADPRQDPD